MLDTIEYIHAKNVIHRDIKPANFVIGSSGNYDKLFLIDFGMALQYKNILTGAHIPYVTNKKRVGTVQYASLNDELGNGQYRRDDMESLAYMWIYFLKASLPWYNGKVRLSNADILHIMLTTSTEEICDGLPVEFVLYINYCRNLRFDEAPAYAHWKVKFRMLFHSLKYLYDGDFDWIKKIEH